jgi:hypothetical protein
MKGLPRSKSALRALLSRSPKQALATRHYPSRGQTAIQEIHQTAAGKLFLKKTSAANLKNCQIDAKSGTLAEREFWAFRLAEALGIRTPWLTLLDVDTTVQAWLDFPDASQYATSQASMKFKPANVFDCALFDWLTGQIDRHNANYLYDYVEEEIIIIDSAHSFLKYEPALPHYLELFEAGSPRELSREIASAVSRRLAAFKPADFRRLAPLRHDDETKSLLRRHEQALSARTVKDIIALYRRKKS